MFSFFFIISLLKCIYYQHILYIPLVVYSFSNILPRGLEFRTVTYTSAFLFLGHFVACIYNTPYVHMHIVYLSQNPETMIIQKHDHNNLRASDPNLHCNISPTLSVFHLQNPASGYLYTRSSNEASHPRL